MLLKNEPAFVSNFYAGYRTRASQQAGGGGGLRLPERVAQLQAADELSCFVDLSRQQLITDHLNYQFSLTKIFDDTMTAVNGRLRQPSWRFRGTRPEADNGQTSKNADLPEAAKGGRRGAKGTRASSQLKVDQQAKSARSGAAGSSNDGGNVEATTSGDCNDINKMRNSVQIPVFTHNTGNTVSGTDLLDMEGARKSAGSREVGGRTPNRSRPGSSLVYQRSQDSNKGNVNNIHSQKKLNVFKNTLLKESIRNSTKHFPTTLQINQVTKGSPELT